MVSKVVFTMIHARGVAPGDLPVGRRRREQYPVRSIKHECLDRMILFSEKSLRHVIREYMEHYHKERNHQGLGGRIIAPEFEVGAGDIEQHGRIGGLLNFYCREAA